jgi:transposase
MANQYQVMVVDKAAIATALRDAKDIGEYKRLQAIHLRDALGLGIEAIASATGFSSDYVKHIHSIFRRGGLGGVLSKGKGGRYHEHQTKAEEAAFIAPFIEEAKAGHVLEVSRIHRALEEKMNKPLRVQNTYNLLHRHGWRKIAPRPKHPQGDPQAQEAFKKTGRRSSKKRGKKPKS